jgi:hypothetical protein
MSSSEPINREAVLIYLDGAHEALRSAQYNLEGDFFCRALSALSGGEGLLLTRDASSNLSSGDRIAIEEYIHIICRFPDRILSVVLFGSKARRDDDIESDIDLLVLVDVQNNELTRELWHIASDVSLKYNVVLSPHVFGQKRWAETRRIRMPLYRAIETDGVPLTSEQVPL